MHVRTPAQFERWSWMVVLVFNQLYLARQLGQALHRPWESTARPVTPQQVRRVMPTILLQVGTPARPCQPRGKSPGRAKGFRASARCSLPGDTEDAQRASQGQWMSASLASVSWFVGSLNLP